MEVHYQETYDEEDSTPSSLASGFGPFEEIKDRHGFIRRVLAIFIAQLLGAAGVVMIATQIDCIRIYLQDPDNQAPVMGISFAGFFSYGGFGIYISCNQDASSRFPLNTFLILGITASMATMATILSTTFEMEPFITGFGVLGFYCAGVCLFTFNSRFYIVTWKGYAFTLIWGVLSSATLIPFECQIPVMKYMGAFVAMVLLVVLIYHLHRTMRVAARSGLRHDDYIMIALEVNRCWLCPCFCAERRIGDIREDPSDIVNIPDEASYAAHAEIHRRLYSARSPTTCYRCTMPMGYN